MLSFNKINKTKRIFIFMLLVVTTFFALLFMPSHARYYEDNVGSLAISGIASMSQLLLNNKIIMLSSNSDSNVIHENEISYNSTSYDAGYRYEGPNVDNYVWYNCSSVDSNGKAYGAAGFNYSRSCEKWRIVGTFSGAAVGFTGSDAAKYYTKIIKDAPLSSTYAYDTSIVSGEVCDETLNVGCIATEHYEYSTLSAYLNGTYYNSLSSSAKSLIKPVYWYGSSGLNRSGNAVEVYATTRSFSRKITIPLNVGLMANWDFLLAASHNTTTPCHTITLDEFSGTTYKCYDQTWLYNGKDEWFINKSSGLYFGLYLMASGAFNTQTVDNAAYVKPSVYLDSTVIVLSGNGSATNPYVIDKTTMETFVSDESLFEYTGSYQTFTAKKSGYYFVEAYGAQGGSGMTNGSNNYGGGQGAYTTGSIYLEKNEKLYIYVGGQGAATKDQKAGSAGGWNGGAAGGNDSNYSSSGSNEPGAGSGGASDVRYFGSYTPTDTDLVWNSALGLNSRIMVAAGGGGGGYSGVGGAGGTINGTPPHSASTYPTQTSGNAFGVGATGRAATDGSGGGGGGYYGGTTGSSNGWGGGGSSFVSGYTGCIAIASSSDTANPRTPRNNSSGVVCDSTSAATDNLCSVHYSGKTFVNPTMTQGGRTGHGRVKITYYGESSTVRNDYQLFTAKKDGYYFIEAYGAKGGHGMVNGANTYAGGNGAYTSGYLYLEKNEQIYVYVGTRGEKARDVAAGGLGGFNGGGAGGTDSNFSLAGGNEPGGGGGGATDIRFFSSTPTADDLLWNSAKGLNSRIMVAAGGGGGGYDAAGAYGGGLKGITVLNITTVASQVGGNDFGIGKVGVSSTGGTGGGGGGYYGGYSSTDSGDPGSGGSSFISGYNGCIAIASETDTANPRTARNDTSGAVCTAATASTDTVCSEHYSGKVFDASVMMVNKNDGDGVAYVTYMGSALPVSENLGWTREFDYTDSNMYEFTTPYSGYYKIELWGAQGANANGKAGGKGGYTVGAVYLDLNEILYFVIGGQGKVITANSSTGAGGYNGGGGTKIAGHSTTPHYSGSGGGATHVATITGLLKNLSGYKGVSSGGTFISDKIIAVAGGGGGAAHFTSSNFGVGGHAGGYKGVNGTSNTNDGFGTGGSQTAAGMTNSDTQAAGGLGYGGTTGRSGSVYYGGGGGSGWYGGGGASPAGYSGGGGGSSYIGGSRFLDYAEVKRRMYCYNCTASTGELTYTIKVSCVSSTPTEQCAKGGNGYAKITYLG